MVRKVVGMKTGIAAVVARRQREEFVATAHRIMENCGAVENYKTRVTTKLARHLILNSPFFSHGKHMEITARSLGCGVQEITAKETT